MHVVHTCTHDGSTPSVQVTKELMSHAADNAIFMHCLPRHKEEVDDEVNKVDLWVVYAGFRQENRRG